MEIWDFMPTLFQFTIMTTLMVCHFRFLFCYHNFFSWNQVKNHTNVNIRIKNNEKEHTPILQYQKFPNPKDCQISIYKSCLNHKIQILVCICLSHYIMSLIETSSSHKPNKNCHQQNTSNFAN
jgi:hypothetical protein